MGVIWVYLFLWRIVLLFWIEKHFSSIYFLFIISSYLLLNYSFPLTYNFTYLLFGFSKYRICLPIFNLIIHCLWLPCFISYSLLLIYQTFVNLCSLHYLRLWLTIYLCTVAKPYLLINNSIRPDPSHGF